MFSPLQKTETKSKELTFFRCCVTESSLGPTQT